MITFTRSQDLNDYLDQHRKNQLRIGFTPTMGALHEGHFSLVQRSINENDLSICSIFVNPTQFNEKSDLDKYPRTVESDQKGLEAVGCDILYLPDVEDVYPEGSDYELDLDLEGLDSTMEGAKRPGHFEGVVQVVKRLLDITQCDRLYMGQKDFQQFTIINHMIEKMSIPVELVVCATVRDEDGLAMSSRNRRLTPEHRKRASIIYRVLMQAKEWLEIGRSPIEISTKAMEYLSIPGFSPEYFDLIDGKSLHKAQNIEDTALIVACTAVWAGEVRLIDNMILKGSLPGQLNS